MEDKINVPFVNLGLSYKKYRSEILSVIDEIGFSGQYILGKHVEEFERLTSNVCGTKFSIGVGNGTDALALILRSIGIGLGDEVITVSNSFLATAGAIVQVGAKPIFCDVSNDLNIDASSLESKITDKTKAIIVVHLAGRPVDFDLIKSISDKYGIPVVEDAAQAIGAKYDGKPIGSLGVAAAFSLHPLKNIGVMGDAGFVTTNNSMINEYIRLARNHGLVDRDMSEFFSVNTRLDAIQAAIANIKIKELDYINFRHREIAKRYINELKNIVYCPEEIDKIYSVYHNFIIQVDAKKRESLIGFLGDNGIEAKIHYPIPIHKMKAYSIKGVSLIKTEELAEKIVSLPIYPELTDKQISYTIDKIKEFFGA